MAQTYKMKHNPQGTIYSLLTVESDGRMTMTFHGTDREICHEVTENADGWLCYPGAMFPGLESGRWQEVAVQMRNEKLEMRNEVAESETTTDNTDCTDSHTEPEVIEDTTDVTDLEPSPVYTDNAELEQLREENQRLQEQIAQMADVRRVAVDEPVIVDQPHPRRQRKPRKPRVERQEPLTVNQEPLTVNRQTSDTLKAIGMVAAATVALFVIYETGLLIPLGLIGLATGGILK